MTVFITDDMHAQLLGAIKQRSRVREPTDANTTIMERLIMCIKMLGNLTKRCTRGRHIRLTNIKMRIKINDADGRCGTNIGNNIGIGTGITCIF